MAKLLDLPPSYLPSFLDILSGGLTLGQLLYTGNFWQEGSLSVWVPDHLTSLASSDFQTDPFFPEIYGLTEPVAPFLKQRLSGLTEAWVFGETFYSASYYEKLGTHEKELLWFALDRPGKPDDDACLCVSLKGSRGVTEEQCDELLRECSGYPTVLAVSSPTADLPVRKGTAPLIDHETLKSSIRPQHVLVGVFDEMSLMMWSRR